MERKDQFCDGREWAWAAEASLGGGAQPAQVNLWQVRWAFSCTFMPPALPAFQVALHTCSDPQTLLQGSLGRQPRIPHPYK
eukprot:1159313-Pelagomonas_calceolata.AAC.10